jgi:hypothetical protein
LTIMAMSPITHQIDYHVFTKYLPEFHSDFTNVCHGFDIVTIDV